MVTLTVERYTELIMAELKLKMIAEAVSNDQTTYGYSGDTSRFIDAILKARETK